MAVAARLLSDPEATVRVKAIHALRGLRAREKSDLLRPFVQSPDPHERKAAVDALAVLEAPDPPN